MSAEQNPSREVEGESFGLKDAGISLGAGACLFLAVVAIAEKAGQVYPGADVKVYEAALGIGLLMLIGIVASSRKR